MSTPEKIALIAGIIAVVGWPTSAFIAYRFGLRSQRIAREFSAKSAAKDRRREFLAFMRSWRVEVGRTFLVSGGREHHGSSFSDVVSSFAAQAEFVREDFSIDRRKQFDGLVSDVTSCSGGDLYVAGGHEKIQKTFDDIIQFVETAA